jgi:3-oxoacyl-[acyl-carrier-protein] synthase II
VVTGPVAITGIGLVTPCGRGVEANWRAITEGSTALRRGAGETLPAWARWAGRVDTVAPPEDLPASLRPQLRFLNRGALLALAAAADAVAAARAPESIPQRRRSLYLATGDLTAAGCSALAPATRAATRGAGRREIDSEVLNRTAVDSVNPFMLLDTLANNPYSIVSAACGLMGPGTTLASHSPQGSQALDLASRSVAAGRTELAVVVASGCWIDVIPRLEMATIGLLSRCRDGARSFRPLDRRRDGFIVGEGAAALVLENPTAARRRGAPILGLIEATGGGHVSSPGLAPSDHITLHSMRHALAQAGGAPSDLAFVIVHGSGTRKGDHAELRSLAALREETDIDAPLCALKPHTGHMGAASDLHELVIGLEGLRRATAPGTLNFASADPDLAESVIPSAPAPCTGRRFLSVSYGLGGQSAAVVVRAPDGG